MPTWFDLCRDLTERWVHQQHVRDAVGRPGDHGRFLPLVLGTSAAWRQLTGLPVAPETVSVDGPAELVEPLLTVRGIIV